MSFWKDLGEASDKWGLVLPPHADSSGNGVRYTADAVLAALNQDKLTPFRKEYFARIFSQCEHQKHPGLLMRTPDNGFGYQSVDDTVGALTAGYFIGNGFPMRWLNHGRRGCLGIDESDPNFEKVKLSRKIYWALCLLNFSARVPYVFNNRNPGKFAVASWLGRQQQVVAHAQFAAGENVPLWRQIWWCISIFSSAYATHPDGWVLACHLVKVARGKSWLCDKVGNFWRRKFRQKYREGLGEVLFEYWGDHPNTRYLHGEFGQ